MTASSTVLSWNGSSPCARPALFTSTSTPPNASTAGFTLASTSSRLLTSRTSVSTRIPYCCSKSSLIATKRSARRPASNKLSPSLANARAHSRPIPEVAPVTKILRFISIPPLKDGPEGLPKPPPAGSDYALRASQGQSRFWKPFRTCLKNVILISRKDFRYEKRERK